MNSKLLLTLAVLAALAFVCSSKALKASAEIESDNESTTMRLGKKEEDKTTETTNDAIGSADAEINKEKRMKSKESDDDDEDEEEEKREKTKKLSQKKKDHKHREEAKDDDVTEGKIRDFWLK